jgi:predicted TPR repeat methyltransferase
MAEHFLERVYDLASQRETDSFYSDWAPTYNRELTSNGYRTPQRCAEALAQFVAQDRPVLDIGCGTGLSGVALSAVGFTDISGQDVNPEMVGVARQLDLYRELRVVDVNDAFPFVPGTYDALAAVGVIGAGAAPASLLTEALAALAVGGCLVFSFNDHVLDDPAYTGVLDRELNSGAAEQLYCEHGPHIEGLGSGSNVYVLRRS